MRRTQQERREETIGKLLDATVGLLAEQGYANASVGRICKRAGVSQGALFNHFDTRLDVMVAATDRICRDHVTRFDEAVATARGLGGDPIRHLVAFVRDVTRSDEHAAWHEVVIAARTDRALRDGVYDAIARFEDALLEAARRFLRVPAKDSARVDMVMLTLMHAFDSEAMTVKVHPNPEIEAARIDWAAELIRAEMGRLPS